MRRTQGGGGAPGFTLVELLIVLAVIAVALSLVAPSYAALMERSQQRYEINRLHMSVFQARSEAIKRNRTVVFCPQREVDDDPGCGGILENGWLLFVDEDRDRELSEGDRLLRRFEPVDPGISIRNRRNTRAANERIVFRPDGSARRALTFTVCSRRLPELGPRSLVLNRVGRPRVSSEWGECTEAPD